MASQSPHRPRQKKHRLRNTCRLNSCRATISSMRAPNAATAVQTSHCRHGIGPWLRAGLPNCIDEGNARGRAHGITEPASPAAEDEHIAEHMQIKLIGRGGDCSEEMRRRSDVRLVNDTSLSRRISSEHTA